MRVFSCLSAIVCGSVFATAQSAESALSFVDLRAQGGLLVSESPVVSLSLMAGDIGNKNKHVISMDADLGIVIGLRGLMSEITAEFKVLPGDVDLKIGGGSFLGGLGFYLGKHSHAELLVGYGGGAGTVDGTHPWDDQVAKYRHLQAELGWYYTWSTHLQVGLTGGYSIMKVKVNTTAGDEKAEIHGFDAGLALGYRF